MSAQIDVFDPVEFSLEENEFLIKHLGEPPVIALKDIRVERLQNPHPKDTAPFHYPDGVNPKAVRPIIERVYELEELAKHDPGGPKWVGIQVLKDAAQVYVDKNRKWKADTRRGAPRFPSLYSFDARGGRHLSGTGSDAGKVQTYFGEDGKRVKFAVHLFELAETDWKPEWADADKPDTQVGYLLQDDANSRFECLVPVTGGGKCGHTESYKLESRQSQAAARGRMSKHFRQATVEVDAHREAHTLEFGGTTK